MNFVKKGSTLIELLVGFAMLGVSGALLLGFLHRNPMSQKAPLENTGREYSKRTLLLITESKDTIYEYKDTLGVLWETLVQVQEGKDEVCIKAFSVRKKNDTTRTLTYCKYP